jgi:dihydrofolate reductase
METQYYTATSLDGFIADPQNSLDWLMQFPEGPGDSYEKFIAQVGAIAMGSTTYDWVLDHHVFAQDGTTKPWPYTLPTWVFSSRNLRAVPGANIRFARGDVQPVHRAMAEAAGGKNIWLVGGGELVGQFYDHGLLDEVIVTIASVTLGGGAPLLPRNITSPPLRRTSVSQRGASFAELRYEVPRRELDS